MTTSETEESLVDMPNHYMMFEGVEVKDIIEKAITLNNISSTEAYPYGNVIKYMLRCGRKGTFKQDLRKAKKYIEIMLDDCQ